MANTIRANINTSGQVLQTWLNRKVLENLEPELRFMDLWQKPVRQDGYNVLSWTRMDQFRITAANALLNEWVTPTEEDLRMTTISLTPKQYGFHVIISDMLLDTIAIPLVSQAAKEIWNNMARIIDEVIQANLVAGATNVILANDVAWVNPATLWATDVLKAKDIWKVNAFLSTKAAKPFSGDAYAMVVHPNVMFDLEQDTAAGALVQLKKYQESTQIMKGEYGMLFGVRFIKSAFVQTITSTVTVYPSFCFGRDAYWVATLQSLQSYITPRTASDSDPLAQRVKVWAKVAFESIILQPKAYLLVYSASSLNYAW